MADGRPFMEQASVFFRINHPSVVKRKFVYIFRCHPERGEGSMHFETKCIDSSLATLAQNDTSEFVNKSPTHHTSFRFPSPKSVPSLLGLAQKHSCCIPVEAPGFSPARKAHHVRGFSPGGLEARA